MCFKNLKSAFFDQNINRLELEGHGHDELRNDFYKMVDVIIYHTHYFYIFRILCYDARKDDHFAL